MHKYLHLSMVTLALFGAASSSSTLQLNNYSLGSSSSNAGRSTTYYLEGSAGEISAYQTLGSQYNANNGPQQSQQANVPPAPTLSNNSNTYYNKLLITLATGNNPSDTTYSIAVSSDNFSTTNYVQTDGTLGATPIYRTYSQWGGAAGSLITGLNQNTAYKAKADALQGLFTATTYGPASAAVTTAVPILSFSLTPNTLSLGTLTPGTVVSSSTATVGYSTNGATGGFVYITGQYGGLYSTKANYTLASASGDISSLSSGFGAQSSSSSQTSGSTFSAVSPYNGSGTTIGAVATKLQPLYATSGVTSGGSGSFLLRAKSVATTPASNDYQEILSLVAAANF